MELYLIRHGQSTNNRGDQRVPDPPLTEIAQEQARRAGEWLKGEGITRLYCSPMLRNLHTAKIVGDILGLAPHIFTGLHEMGGIFEDLEGEGRRQLPGMTRSEMREFCPNVVLTEDITDKGWWFREWNDFSELVQLAYDNGLAFIAHLNEHHIDTNERVAAITHGGSGSIFLCALFGLPHDVGYTRFGQNNTGISKIEITADQTRLRYLNRIVHLPKELVT